MKMRSVEKKIYIKAASCNMQNCLWGMDNTSQAPSAMKRELPLSDTGADAKKCKVDSIAPNALQEAAAIACQEAQHLLGGPGSALL